GMTGNDWLPVGSRTVVRHQETVDELGTGVEESRVPRRAIVGNRSLQHVAEVVEVVPDFLAARKHALRSAVFHVIRVQASVGLLHGDDFANHAGRYAAKFRHVARLQGYLNRFGPLVNIGVGVIRAFLGSFTLPYQAAKIIHATVLLQ